MSKGKLVAVCLVWLMIIGAGAVTWKLLFQPARKQAQEEATAKEKLLEECNLHTIVRLPNSVFEPYASIGTNLLFFEKGTPTKAVTAPKGKSAGARSVRANRSAATSNTAPYNADRSNMGR